MREIDRPRSVDLTDHAPELRLITRCSVGIGGDFDLVDRDQEPRELHVPAVHERRIAIIYRGKWISAEREHLTRGRK